MLKERKWKIVTRFFLSLFLLRAQKEEMESDSDSDSDSESDSDSVRSKCFIMIRWNENCVCLIVDDLV
mgnify:FL=1